MALSKEIYKEFEDIVGAPYICDDPAVMPAYHQTQFAAIILPKNTAEVQSIVRLCNKHKVAFRPVCTGWSGQFAANTLYIDLRRLNRIIEINEKHMYAVVEPYVITAQLQAELFKRGFHMNVKGAGANCTAMLRGHGHLDQTTSGDDRNHLAIEWVTPEGNLEIPENFMARYYSFPSVEKMWQAEIRLGENEICFELMGFNVAMVAANITTCNEEEEKVFKQMEKDVIGPGFFVIIAGNSKADFEYKKKVLETIVAEAEGQSLKYVEDPRIEGILICQCIRISASIRETFRPGGAFSSIPVMGQRDLTIRWAVGAGKAKLPLIEQGLIVDDGGGFFGWGVEQGHLGKTEIFCKFDPLNLKAKAAVENWSLTQSKRAFEERYFANTMRPHSEIGPDMSNFHIWWKKVTQSLDPNNVSPEAGALV